MGEVIPGDVLAWRRFIKVREAFLSDPSGVNFSAVESAFCKYCGASGVSVSDTHKSLKKLRDTLFWEVGSGGVA